MNSWDKGYVSEIDYTYGYYTELNPYRLMFAANYLGYKAPTINTACELGFGQGVSLNINAASQPIDWYGCDFNPSQARFAKDLGKFSGIAENIFEDDFEAFLHRPDLPNFDYICLHGIWSWVSEELRHVLLDFLRKYLNPGGLVYISYNSLAQFSELVPLRNLMKYYLDNCQPKSAPLSNRIEASLGLVNSLQKMEPANITNSKTLESRLKWISKLDKNYLAHEYFNDSWHPFSFSQISSHLKQAKLSFLTSAFFPDSLDALNFNASQIDFLSGCLLYTSDAADE